MFERTLADLIRGLRASNKQDEATFIARAVDEIRKEVKSKDMELKAAAILKLTYLDMMGYDMSWASFNVVEVMSSAKIHLKSIGYLAAVQSFKDDTDVLMLTTNTLKKDLASSNPPDIATALDGLSHIITTDIARDLSLDLIAMLNHSRPQIRKRAVLVMFKVFEKYPEVIPRSMDRLRLKLEDTDPSVVSATVNILCELARRNPQQYLPLAPQLFDLLTTSSNNWMLIKLIKLLGSLTPHEPRLAKKLQKPIGELIATTPAVSLLYECVHTCIIGGMLNVGTSGSAGLAKTCVNKLSAFLSDPDQNLKYIALLALVKIVPTHPHLVAVHQNEILASLDDQDLSIRMRALDLVTSMATPSNLKSIIKRLISHLVPPSEPELTSPQKSASQALAEATSSPSTTAAPSTNVATPAPNPNLDVGYRKTLSKRIIGLCSRFASDAYSSISVASYNEYDEDGGNDTDFDFTWYVSVLVDLTYVAPASVGTGIGKLIKDELMDVAVRVGDLGVRRQVVELMVRIVGDEGMLEGVVGEGGDGKVAASEDEKEGGGESDVLSAAAWICGEYCSEISTANALSLLDHLLKSPHVLLLPSTTQASYVQAASKVFGQWLANLSSKWNHDEDEDESDDDKSNRAVELEKEILQRVDDMKVYLERFASSEWIEVQERAANMLQLLAFIKADVTNSLSSKSKSTAVSTNTDIAIDPMAPTYPKSLFLIHPLYARPLRPIPHSSHVSSSTTPAGSTWSVPTLKNLINRVPKKVRVPVPEGLDLDKWIVPPPVTKIERVLQEGDENDPVSVDFGGVKKRKGKEKDRDGDGKLKTKKKKAKNSTETEEEKAARVKRKAELAEQRRHDPYYLTDKKTGDNDVDSIPVVKLELNIPSLSSGTSTPARTLQSQQSYTSVRSNPPTPNFGTPSVSSTPTPPSSLLNSSILSSSLIRKATPTPLSGGFAPYEEGDEVPVNERTKGVDTPEPIKVTKVKKKKAKSTKSKSNLTGDANEE